MNRVALSFTSAFAFVEPTTLLRLPESLKLSIARGFVRLAARESNWDTVASLWLNFIRGTGFSQSHILSVNYLDGIPPLTATANALASLLEKVAKDFMLTGVRIFPFSQQKFKKAFMLTTLQLTNVNTPCNTAQTVL